MFTALLLLVAVLLLVAANALFVGVEFGFLTVDRSEVRRARDEGDAAAGRLDEALSKTSTNLSGAQLGITVSSLVVGYLTGPSVGKLLESLAGSAGVSPAAATGISMTIAFVVVTFLQMVFGELVPKNWAIAVPMRVARLVAPPQRAFMAVFGWLVTALNAASNAVLRALGLTPQEEPDDARTAEELRASAARSGREGSMDPRTAQLITRSLAFGELRADDVMLPRPLVTFLQDASAQDLLDTVAATGHSRFPVLGTGVDDVVGIVHYRHALAVPPEKRATTPVRELAVDVLVVSESMTLDPLMRMVREAPLQAAVVVDEYGGTAGLVTLEELVEEIVGEIDDEQDEKTLTYSLLDDSADGVTDGSQDGAVVGVDGLLRPDELGDVLLLDLPQPAETATLTGLFSEHVDRLPEPGDRMVVDALDHENRDEDDLPTHARVHLRVESMKGHRVGRVRAWARRGVAPGSDASEDVEPGGVGDETDSDADDKTATEKEAGR